MRKKKEILKHFCRTKDREQKIPLKKAIIIH